MHRQLPSATECELGLENTAIKVGYSEPCQQLTKQKNRFAQNQTLSKKHSELTAEVRCCCCNCCCNLPPEASCNKQNKPKEISEKTRKNQTLQLPNKQPHCPTLNLCSIAKRRDIRKNRSRRQQRKQLQQLL
jgi:hypothetical protein